MMITAIVVCFILLIVLGKRTSVKLEDRIYGGSFAVIGGLLGAKLLSVATTINIIIEYQLPLIDIIKNGFVFYGGLIGGIAGLFIYCRLFKVRVIDFFDFGAIILPLGQAIGRVGCLAAGCCFGHETESFLGIEFHSPLDPNVPIDTPILPTQIFESIYCLILFVALLTLSRKKRERGTTTLVYLFSYGICRFINEFFRGDAARGFLFGISTSQIISLLMIVIGIGFLIYRHNRAKRRLGELKP
jgi:phosphatidylglycerol:prolipoprotein diacylglycerol transferase